MSVLGTFFSKLATVFSSVESKAKAEISTLPERNWASLRWIGLLALIALIIYNQTAKLITLDSLAIIYRVFCVWLVCNTITRAVTIWGNAKVHVAEVTALKQTVPDDLDPDAGETLAQLASGQTPAPSVAQQLLVPVTKTP